MLDKEAALARLDNDQELYEEICFLFKTEAVEMFENLCTAVQDGKIPEAVRCAHSLKSVSASVGAMELSEASRTAEAMGKADDLGNLQSMLPRLDQLITRVIAEL